MALPINIEELIKGNSIECERIEFKMGWNPEAIIRTICAFANDLHNWGGGYIIIGVDEIDGKAQIPPIGLEQGILDEMQKKIIELGHQIQPHYFPIMQPYVWKGKHILVLWCPAGNSGMYTAPTTLGGKAQRQPYIRVGTESVVAKGEHLRQLTELSVYTPFDDRVNNQATINDFDLGLIQAYLQEVKSDLYGESIRMSLTDLAKAMLIAKGPDEDVRPINVGLLFFSKTPELFFPRSWIELVWHKDESGQRFEEHYFKGCLQAQLRNALSFIQTNVIVEKTIKQRDKAEALRFANFPFAAVEEALSNAVYHKSYERPSPIEVQVWADKIEILSFPGPIPPVSNNVLKTKRRIVAREYRNRRIGDFLKELQLTEGRGTGFPTIYSALEANGSPSPIFETDDNSTYFLTVIPVHPLAEKSVSNTRPRTELFFDTMDDLIAFGNQASNQASNQVSNQVSNQAISQAVAILNSIIHSRVKEILMLLQARMSREDLFAKMGITNQTTNRGRYLDPLLSLGWVEMEFPDKKTSPKQTYKTSESGKRILWLLNYGKNE